MGGSVNDAVSGMRQARRRKYPIAPHFLRDADFWSRPSTHRHAVVAIAPTDRDVRTKRLRRSRAVHVVRRGRASAQIATAPRAPIYANGRALCALAS